MGKTQEERYQDFKGRLQASAQVMSHDLTFIDALRARGFTIGEDWEEDADGFWNLTTQLRADGQVAGGWMGQATYGPEVEDMYLRWLFTGQERYIVSFYEWFCHHMADNRRARRVYSERRRREEAAEAEAKARHGEIGYIYVIRTGTRCKIGKSKRRGDRIQTHSASNPDPIEVILEERVAGYHAAEKQLHDFFAKKRLRNEWFSLDQDDINIIREMLAVRQPQEVSLNA